jgi:peptide/nickel transport system permease protein
VADEIIARPAARTRRLPRARLLPLGLSVILVAVALLAPWLAPADPLRGNVLSVLQPPSVEHLLGTDGSGRDLLSRLIFGSRTALLGPLVVVSVSVVIGSALGLAGAWHGGWVDAVIGRMLDILFSFPSMLLALVLVAVLSPGLITAALAVSVAFVPPVARIVRSVAVREVAAPYVEALYLQGMSSGRILLRHVLGNLWPIIVAQATLGFGYAMIELAGISFLGLGVQAPAADWGVMIDQGQASIVRGFPQESLLAGALLVIAVVSFISLGDSLADRGADGRR